VNGVREGNSCGLVTLITLITLIALITLITLISGLVSTT
jgi:hypothetical protein